MSRVEENSHFKCINCSENIEPLNNGSYRNHCPSCLFSLHVDIEQGDRKNNCRGPMSARQLVYKKKKGWQIVHKCQKCGHEKVNKIADNCVQPDDINLLIKLMGKN